MTSIPWYLQPMPNGKYRDIRIIHNVGSMLQVVSGPYAGHTVLVCHITGQVAAEGGGLVDMPGYGVVLENGKAATVAWDAVRPA